MAFGTGVDYELFLLREGVKSVVKRECVAAARVDAIRQQFAAEGLHVACDLGMTYEVGATDDFDHGEGESRFQRGSFVTVYIGRDPLLAQRAMDLNALEARRDAISPQAARDATLELGGLLGYPTCCVEAFNAGVNTPTFTRGTAGFYLDGYHRTVGPFHPLLNRFALSPAYLSHAPCTYGCVPSIAIAERVHAEVERHSPQVAAANAIRLRRPVLFWSFDERVAFDVVPGSSAADGSIAYQRFEPSRASRGDGDAFGAFLTLLERGDAISVQDGAVCVFANGVRIGAALDVVPMTLPFLFRWDATAYPYDRVPQVAFLDTRTSGHDFFDNRMAVIAGDLRRQGVDARVYHIDVGRSDAPEERARAERVAAEIAAAGTTLAVVARFLSEPLMRVLGEHGVSRFVLQTSGSEPEGTVDHSLIARLRDTRGEGRAQGRIQSLREVLSLLGRGHHEPIVEVDTLADAIASDLRVHVAPYEPVVRYESLDGKPPPEPEQWFFIGNTGCPFSKKYSDPTAASYLPVVRRGISLRGCNFCEMGGDYARVEWKRDLGPRLAASMDWVRQRAPSVRRFVLGDTYPHPYLAELVGSLRSLRARGFELLVQTRADWLLKNHDQLVAILPQMLEMDAQLVVYLIGFENFSQSELDRMDKNITVQQNFEAIDLLRSLERENPSAFSATKYRSHGFLLFNPWTTLDDLAENAEAIRVKRFHDFRSNVLMTRLRLYPHLPAFHKAGAEGLLLATYDRPEKSSSRWVGYAPEQPWRSLDPRVDTVFELVSACRNPPPESQADLIDLALAEVRSNADRGASPAERVRAFAAAHDDRSKTASEQSQSGNHSATSVQVSSHGPSPDEARAWQLITDSRPEEARDLALAMEARSPGSKAARQILEKVEIQQLFRTGIESLAKSDFSGAERAFRNIRELAPKDPEAARCLARALWGRGERDEAHGLYAAYCDQKGLPAPAPGTVPR